MVSNRILYVPTNVATKASLSLLCIVNSKIWEKYSLFIITNLFLNKCLSPHLKLLSPHVANGDKVGHQWTIGTETNLRNRNRVKLRSICYDIYILFFKSFVFDGVFLKVSKWLTVNIDKNYFKETKTIKEKFVEKCINFTRSLQNVFVFVLKIGDNIIWFLKFIFCKFISLKTAWKLITTNTVRTSDLDKLEL